MPRRNYQSRPGSFALQHGVGGGRSAVVDELEGSRPGELILKSLSYFGNAVLDANALVWDGGWDLGTDCSAVRGEDVDVGEGAANVDTELVSLTLMFLHYGSLNAARSCSVRKAEWFGGV